MSRMAMKAVGLLAAVALPVSVNAASYAVSINDISNFNMWVTGGTINPFAFTFSNDAAALDTLGVGSVNASDAPAACVGACAGWQNQFTSHSSGTSQFSYGDARILNVPVMGGSTGSAAAIGESRVSVGSGYGAGGNTLTAMFEVVTTGTQLHFDFDATLLMQTVLGAGSKAAGANTFMQISITGPGYSFLWSPNGAVDLLTGGTEVTDPFSLNWGISGNNSASFASGTSSFHAMTNGLAAGSYSMNITMTQTATVSAVPVPAAAWLLGSGLLAMAGVARRRAA